MISSLKKTEKGVGVTDMTEITVPTTVPLFTMGCRVTLPSGDNLRQNAEVSSFKLALEHAYDQLDKGDIEVLAAALQSVRDIGDKIQNQITANISEVTENQVVFR